MRSLILAGVAGLTLLSACVPKAEAPAPAPVRPIPQPVRTPSSAPVPAPSSDWRDWALTPGTWRYAGDPRGSRATFGAGGAPLLTLVCDAGANVIRMTRAGVAAGTLTVRTSTTARTLQTQVVVGGVEAVLPARDPLLDAMGFSRGRFVVEGGGGASLVVPAWAEVLRVVEDCRG